MTGHVDIIAQDSLWDSKVGRGSYCCFVRRFPCGTRDVEAHAHDAAVALLADDRRHGNVSRYYNLVRAGVVLERVS